MSNRREFLRAAATAGAVSLLPSAATGQPRSSSHRGDPGERPKQDKRVEILNPRGRVPLSFIIDDSTCLVNMAHFAIPQFKQAYPKRYNQNWRKLPREIPDSFVRKFRDWCKEHGVKGKYSIVPYPSCVGWVDREMPGWSRKELDDSLKLVREMQDDWDIHPEMISHTWVIDLKTGRPVKERTPYWLENAGWSQDKKPEQLAEYIGYALKILKNAGLTCEGHTTPGGFGNRNQANLAKGTLWACRDVYKTEIPHYFRNLYTGKTSVAPRVFYAKNIAKPNPEAVVSIVGCTGDWFGGWDGLKLGSSDLFIKPDLKSGRMVDVIDRGEPAVMVCHWPGIYFNGLELGFNIFKTVVSRLEKKYDHLIWMKNSEIARYWAAKELTAVKFEKNVIQLFAPFASPSFTLKVKHAAKTPPQLRSPLVGKPILQFDPVAKALDLKPGKCFFDKGSWTVCFDLKKGANEVVLGQS